MSTTAAPNTEKTQTTNGAGAYEHNMVLATEHYKTVGTRPIRHDGADKVTGRALYGADIQLSGLRQAQIELAISDGQSSF